MKNQTVTSAHNDRVKFVRGLAEASFRKKHACTVIEGLRLVEEALVSGADFVTVVCDEESTGNRLAALLDRLRSQGIGVWSASPPVFKGMAQTETPQGILAVIRIPAHGAAPEATLKALLESQWQEDSIVVLLDGVQDPGNAGTIVRSADTFGALCVLFASSGAGPYNPKVLRASMGSVFHTPCIETDDLGKTLELLAAAGFRVFYGDARAGSPLFSTHLTGRVAIAVGNEGAGVSPAVRSRGTGVAIPITGLAESLNAATALTVMLYEARRQRAVAL